MTKDEGQMRCMAFDPFVLRYSLDIRQQTFSKKTFRGPCPEPFADLGSEVLVGQARSGGSSADGLADGYSLHECAQQFIARTFQRKAADAIVSS